MDQVNTREQSDIPRGNFNSLTELEKATTKDGALFVLHEDEEAAILLIANNQHLSYPENCTQSYRKVIELYRGVGPFIEINAFKLIRSRIFSLTTSLFSFKGANFFVLHDSGKIEYPDKESFKNCFNQLLSDLFLRFEIYLRVDIRSTYASYLKEVENCLNQLNSFTDKMPREIVTNDLFNELKELLYCFSESIKNPHIYIPYLLIPSTFYPVRPLELERITRIYLDGCDYICNAMKICSTIINNLSNESFYNTTNISKNVSKTKKSKSKQSKSNVLKRASKNMLSNLAQFIENN